MSKSTSEPSRADDPIVLNFASTQYSLNKFVKYFLIICLNHLSRTKSRARPLGHRTLPWTITSLRKWIVRLQWWQSLKSAKHIAKSLWKSISNHQSIHPAKLPMRSIHASSLYLWLPPPVRPEHPSDNHGDNADHDDHHIDHRYKGDMYVMLIKKAVTDPFPGWSVIALGSSRLSDTKVARCPPWLKPLLQNRNSPPPHCH